MPFPSWTSSDWTFPNEKKNISKKTPNWNPENRRFKTPMTWGEKNWIFRGCTWAKVSCELKCRFCTCYYRWLFQPFWRTCFFKMGELLHEKVGEQTNSWKHHLLCTGFSWSILKQKTSKKAKNSVPKHQSSGVNSLSVLGLSYDRFRWGGGDSRRPSFAAAGRDPHDTFNLATWTRTIPLNSWDG